MLLSPLYSKETELSHYCTVMNSVADPYTFFMDPDPGFFFNTDPVPNPDTGNKNIFSKAIQQFWGIILVFDQKSRFLFYETGILSMV